MKNNYYLPPDAWNYNEHQNHLHYHQQELQTKPCLNNATMSNSEMDEPEVEWNQWMQESAMTDSPNWECDTSTLNQLVGTTTSQNMASLDAEWLDQQLAEPMITSQFASTLDADELDELENILFSSPGSCQQADTSTPTSSGSNNSSLSPFTSPSTSPSGSQATPAPTSAGLQQEDGLYPCTSCSRTFPKRHLLNRHLKNHNPAITCPYRLQGCNHRTARNRDMARHVAVHHPAPAAPSSSSATPQLSRQNRHFCHVAGCVSNREGFTRRDNLGRHLKNVHGLRISEVGG